METERIEVLLEDLKGRLAQLLEDYTALHQKIDARAGMTLLTDTGDADPLA